ncbi:hypothetical protein PSHT_13739 [Puccinia striiformis]|uniref:PRELI/MSF1 domain-containing protein n=1 Tax=Puccinia striiformis TaxID=27350 RepID=A0A2S4UPU0_9BASI|nr:hypothetical protein PSHT_13739 [Puccinia striiformis]
MVIDLTLVVSFEYSHPFRFVCQAFTLRYPNPFAPHVITADTLDRSWDAESGILRSVRLVLKRGTIPGWAPRGIVEKSETWVLEESTINVLEGTMTLSNRNLDHRRVMEVVEKITLRAIELPRSSSLAMKTSDLRQLTDRVFSLSDIAFCRTEATSYVEVTSSWGFYAIRKRIEKYGISRFQRQSKNSRHGLELIIKLLRPSSPLRDPLLNAERINYPPSLAPTSPLKSRLRELRLRAQEKQRLISEMLRPGSKKESSPSDPDSEEDEEHEDDSLTAAEEAELEQLEREFSADPSSVIPDPSLPSNPSPQKRRWFWWWRWHLCSDSSSSESKKL